MIPPIVAGVLVELLMLCIFFASIVYNIITEDRESLVLVFVFQGSEINDIKLLQYKFYL